MSSATRTIKVRPVHGELGRFLVESWEHPDRPHQVDLLAHGGQGACSCTDWSTRCRGNQKLKPYAFIPYGTAKKPDPERHACRHVTVARTYFMKEVLQGLAKQHRGGNHDGT
jgi:hypothetical protein